MVQLNIPKITINLTRGGDSSKEYIEILLLYENK